MSDSDNNDLNKDVPPWLQPVPETEEEGGVLSGGRARIAMVVGALAVVAVFAAAIAFLYPTSDEEAPRHIAADSNPIRERPEEAGGMQVDHQDKAVLEIGDGAPATSSVQIGAQPEQPVSEIPDLPEASVADDVEDKIGDLAEAALEEEAPAPAPQDAEPAETTPNVTDSDEAPSVPEGTYAVQLGAYGSEASAQTAWRAVRGRFLGELGELSPIYVPVESGDRTLYRLRVGMLPDRAAADAVCIALRAQQQACFVVNP
ncbi:MAG: SPOR domain-containing protein [Kordiimonadaceae bacterium]|nr:SPOR domain-containing protein [Kordiimonadaceae bacterium]MBO6570593.1 SPOR domain-containing protein [Kordiimonadaceae bacterium]MBO6966549.1 SPOR domain-containing protein [Kordiimonadaceae bacterium]